VAHEVTDVEFDADGITLRGWLYRPRRGAAVAPVVVMAHGYNCVKELYLDRYAAAVADAGRVVLAYDHRNFGESDGEPRQELDPWVQVRHYRNAITFVQMLDGVDAERIGIWGTSYAVGTFLSLPRSTAVCAALSRRCRRLAAGSRRCGGPRRRRFLASATLGMRTALRATKASHRKWSKW
jgi:fermentation-respiration switch protein FrsA (DUF1100 family)